MVKVRTEDQVGDESGVSKKSNEKSKKKYPGFRKNFCDYVQEFTDYTGIHGFKYMGEQDRSIFEKLWWLILFCISLWICISLIIDTWRKWEASPVLVSFAKSPTPVFQIPFPAVTLCPETKAKKSKYNYTDVYDRYKFYGNLTAEEKIGAHQTLDDLLSDEKNLIKLLGISCFFKNCKDESNEYLKYLRPSKKNLSDSALICQNNIYNDGMKTTDLDTIDHLMEVAPQFEDIFFSSSCKWTLINESCYNLFTPTITDDGLCFTFNMLDRSEIFRDTAELHKDYMHHGRDADGWTLENGYPDDAPRNAFPRRAMSAGSAAGLFLLVTGFKQDLDYICRGSVQGFKVHLHHPAELPRLNSHYFRVPLNQEIIVSIVPDMITTSPGLVEYDPHRRQCYFPDEKYLKFFKQYMQQNCEVECLTNYTLSKCGCVAYHMPREASTPICGPGSLDCMFEAQSELLEREVEAAISSYDSEDESTRDPWNCYCLPSCTSLSYDAETTQVPFHWEKIFEGYRADINEFPGIQMSRLTLFFKEQQFITSERNELYGLADFLANCGGILGLFTGFSFLSIVEIVYFLSLRFICNVKMYGRHYWSGSARLIKDYN